MVAEVLGLQDAGSFGCCEEASFGRRSAGQRSRLLRPSVGAPLGHARQPQESCWSPSVSGASGMRAFWAPGDSMDREGLGEGALV